MTTAATAYQRPECVGRRFDAGTTGEVVVPASDLGATAPGGDAVSATGGSERLLGGVSDLLHVLDHPRAPS